MYNYTDYLYNLLLRVIALKTKLVTLAVLSVMCVFICSCSNEKASEGMKIVSDPSCDFYFEVPENWEINYTDSMLAAVDTKDKANVTASAFSLSEEMGADDFWEDYKVKFEETVGTINVNKLEETKLSGIIARHVYYTVDMGQDSYNSQTVVCVGMGRVYMVTFTSSPETYENHTEEFEKILSSYRLK